MKDHLDPFRVLLGVLASEKQSDLLTAVSNLAGLKVNLNLSKREVETRSLQIRALQPRILKAYDALDDQTKLIAAQSAVASLGPIAGPLLERLHAALASIGWVVSDGKLTAVKAELREISSRGAQNGTRSSS